MGASAREALSADRVLATLRQRREEMIDAFAIEVAGGRDPGRVGDVREAAEAGIDLILAAMSERRALDRDDVMSVRPYFRHAMLRGAGEADLLRSCRQVQGLVWRFLDEIAGSGAAGRAIQAELCRPLVDYVEAFSEVAAETYAEVQEAMSSTRRNASRRLIEDLLAGRAPEAGAAIELLRRSELGSDTPLTVLTAAPKTVLDDESALMVAAAVLSRAGGDAAEPVFGVRDGEVVIVRAMHDDAERYVEALEAACRRLRRDAIMLRIGVSAEHIGVPSVPSAYQEAWLARERVDGDGGLVALATMTPFDYMLLRAGDRTAWQLVPARTRRFIDDDLSQAGLLIETLMAYLESNLNAKLAAERLFVHPNTAHYRLGKIADLTGYDLRSHADLMQLAVAIQLARRR